MVAIFVLLAAFSTEPGPAGPIGSDGAAGDNATADLEYVGSDKALFDGRCPLCHGDPEFKGDLDLTSYEGLLQGGNNGSAIVPGDPANSLLILRQSEQLEHGG